LKVNPVNASVSRTHSTPNSFSIIRLSRALYKNNTFCFNCITFHSLSHYDSSQLYCWITVLKCNKQTTEHSYVGNDSFLGKFCARGGGGHSFVESFHQSTW